MSIVTITLNNRKFKLSCPTNNHERLIKLSHKLDYLMDKIKQDNPAASFEVLLIISALSIIDDNESKEPDTSSNTRGEVSKNLLEIVSALNSLVKKIET